MIHKRAYIVFRANGHGVEKGSICCKGNEMRTVLSMLIVCCMTVGYAAMVIAGETKAGPEGWHSGIGTSSLEDAYEAGEEAARKAKSALGGVEAKIVVVAAAINLTRPEVVEGVASQFPKDIIYGCQVASPLTVDGNYPDFQTIDSPLGVAVWALGGDVDVTPGVQATDPDAEDPYYEAGISLGEYFKPLFEKSTRPGNIMVTFGDQYNGSNKDFAAGLNDGLDATYAIIGAAAGNITSKVIVKGEIVTGVNVGLLLSGDFKLGMAMNGGTHTPETADKTLKEALAQGDGEDPFFALIFNCRRRRQGMIEAGQLGDEHQRIKENLKNIEFFGFYGPGEIGTKKTGEASEGVGFTVVTAVFFPVK